MGSILLSVFATLFLALFFFFFKNKTLGAAIVITVLLLLLRAPEEFIPLDNWLYFDTLIEQHNGHLYTLG